MELKKKKYGFCWHCSILIRILHFFYWNPILRWCSFSKELIYYWVKQLKLWYDFTMTIIGIHRFVASLARAGIECLVPGWDSRGRSCIKIKSVTSVALLECTRETWSKQWQRKTSCYWMFQEQFFLSGTTILPQFHVAFVIITVSLI